MNSPDLTKLSGEQLRKEAKRADRAFGDEIDRVQLVDAQFRWALNHCLAVEAEQLRRRNK